jgi:hypothetical protein
MGNHDAGRAMGRAAEMWWLGRDDIPPTSSAEALRVLDTICEPYRGSDAEFEAAFTGSEAAGNYNDYRDPDAPLGRLMIVAFEVSPNVVASIDEEEDNRWYEEVVVKFKDRYDFY